MNRRIISALIVFLLLTSVAISTAAAVETSIVTEHGHCKNGAGGIVADCELSVWFDYNCCDRPTPHVVECNTNDPTGMHECTAEYAFVDYPAQAIRVVSTHTAQAHPHIDIGIGTVGFHTPKRTCRLYVSCDKQGTIDQGSA